MSEAPPEFLSLADAAKATGLSERSIRRAISAGTIPGYRHGAAIRVKRADLDLLFRPIPSAVSE